MSDFITENSQEDHLDRRGFLKCMAWAGTGVLYSVSGGILSSRMLSPSANAAETTAAASFNFVQISDSHIGYISFYRPLEHIEFRISRRVPYLLSASQKR
jgi:hypothetical protein